MLLIIVNNAAVLRICINNIVPLFSEVMQEVMDTGSTTCNDEDKLGVAYTVKCVALK